MSMLTGFEYDPETAIAALSRADGPMAALIERVGPFSLKVGSSSGTFEALTRAIVYQQLSGKAAQTIYTRLLALFPGGCFPEPGHILATPDEVLRAAGISRAKLAAIKDLAAKTLNGTVPALEALKTLSDAEIVARLVTVRGIGRWTVEMLLIFQLGRADVLPVSDLGVRKGFMHTYGTAALPTAAELLAHGERWRPYRSVASWYFWRALETAAR